MANRVNIFISASSSDLRTFRSQVTAWLLNMGWYPVVQDHFETPDDKTVIQMLRKEIKKSDAVLHIIGQHYGAEPQSSPKGGSRKSYTQLEADLAVKLRKRLFIVLLDENFPYDPHEPEPEDRRILQQAYRLQVATGDRLYIVGSTPADLEPKIRKLRVEVDKLSKSRRYFTLLLTVPLLIALVSVLWLLNNVVQSANKVMEAGNFEKTLEDARKTGPSSDPALVKLRDQLRKYRPDIDNLSAEQVVAIAGEMIDNVKNPAARPDDLSSPVKQVLDDAQVDAGKLSFAEGAEKLDKKIAQFKTEEAGRTRDYAALLADRGRFSRLQFQYREAAGFYRQAADLMAADSQTARGYLLDAADSLYAQGNEFGDNQALSDAIHAYNSALATAPRERDPLDWAKIQNKIANTLEKLGERESKTDHLEAAVAAYSQVLEIHGREHAQEWAATQNDLAYALIKLGERESGTARFEAARTACTDALDALKQAQVHDTRLWAAVQNNLGNALLRLADGESTTLRLEGAIQAYNEALKVRTRADAPFDWAATESNRALALETLGEGETGTAHLEEAVAAYGEVLEVRTRKRLPVDWAATQNNLGLALEALGERETGTARLEAAVAAFKAALTERPRDRMAYDWAETNSNLGIALQALGKRETGTAQLDEAVTAYNNALSEITREKSQTDWAMFQDNLGKVLQTLGEREPESQAGTIRLKAAVAAFNEALKVYTRDAYPGYWAEAQNDLGNALKTLGERENGTGNLEAAVAAFSEALKVRTRDQMPLKWAASIGDQGVAQMLLAKRKQDVDMARAAFEKIEVAYTMAQSGGDSASAADYSVRLTEARTLIDQLIKRGASISR